MASKYWDMIVVSLRNSYANANDTIALFCIQMQMMGMHQVIVTAIAIMADLIVIYRDKDYGDDNLVHAHLYQNTKQRYHIVCVNV